jgi:DNA-binding NtrC family response regulator
VSAAPLTTRLLLVEDNDDDAELLSLELTAAGLAFELRRVETQAHLRDAMAAFDPHLVISDSNLPGFSGLEALSLVMELSPATPFLLFSGDEQEHLIADALVRGASACVSKQHLDRMPATIASLLTDKAATARG